MKKPIAFLLSISFFATSCGSSAPKKTSSSQYHKGTKSQKYVKTDLDAEDVLYDKLDRNKSSRVHYTNYIQQNGEFDIPFTNNEYVQKWVNYFTGKGRGHFERYLARSGRMIPYIQAVLKEYGVPTDIAYLSMIESGFNMRAQSWASAVGPWQFIRSTGAMYDLNVDYYVDERRDVEKSTHAAAQHLKDLYGEFGDWYLAFAAYNAGAGKVRGAIQRNGTNFWDMVRGSYLRQETKDYVPKILAAALVAKNPEKYGFRNIDYQSYIPTETVTLKGPTDIETAARCAGVDADLIRLLNSELLQDMTPPNQPNYALKIPKGTKEAFEKKYASLKPQERMGSSEYIVKRGDTVTSIAQRYGVSEKSLVEANRGLIDVGRDTRTKKVQVAYGKGKRKSYRTQTQTYTVSSYDVNPGAALMIPVQRSLGNYASSRDDEAAYNAQSRFGSKGLAQASDTRVAAKDSSRKRKSDAPQLIEAQPVSRSSSAPMVARNDYNDLQPESGSRPSRSGRMDLIDQVIAKKSDLQDDNSDRASAPAPTVLAKAETTNPSESARGPLAFQSQPDDTQAVNNANSPSADELRAAVNDLKSELGAPAPIAQAPAPKAETQWVPAPAETKVAAAPKPSEKTPAKKEKAAASRYYTIKSGDTLASIAKTYGISMAELKEMNGQKVHPVLLRGSKILVQQNEEATQVAAAAPAPAPKASSKAPVTSAKVERTYEVRPGDNIAKVSKRFGVSVAQLKQWNGNKVASLESGEKIVIQGPVNVKYKVKAGDNLIQIAEQHSTTPDELRKLNKLKSNTILPGAMLVLPQ